MNLWESLEELFEKHKKLTLREARFVKGISQQILEEQTGISQPKISMHETAGLRLNAKEQEKIEIALNLINKIKWEENIMEETPLEMPEININKAASTADMKTYLEEKYGVAKAALLISSMTDAELKEFTKEMEIKGNEINAMPAMPFKKGE